MGEKENFFSFFSLNDITSSEKMMALQQSNKRFVTFENFAVT